MVKLFSNYCKSIIFANNTLVCLKQNLASFGLGTPKDAENEG